MDVFEEIKNAIEMINEVNAMRDPASRVFRNIINPFDIYSNSEFRQRY